MNIILVKRGIDKLDKEIRGLAKKRDRAKDKVRWDAKNGQRLSDACHEHARLCVIAQEEIKRLGYFGPKI